MLESSFLLEDTNYTPLFSSLLKVMAALDKQQRDQLATWWSRWPSDLFNGMIVKLQQYVTITLLISGDEPGYMPQKDVFVSCGI